MSAEGTFERNTRAVGSALRAIKRADPEAVVMVGTYGPCAEFIKLAHTRGFNPTFVAISFVGANALAKELGAEGNGVIVSQVVPFPWDKSLQLVADYRAAEQALDPRLTPDFVSLEGYLSGRLVAAVLELAGENPTRADLLRLIGEVGRFDIGGDVITFGAKARELPAAGFPDRHPGRRHLQGDREALGDDEAGVWPGASARRRIRPLDGSRLSPKTSRPASIRERA